MHLYNIARELRAIDATIEELDGELPADLEQALDSWEAEWSTKVDSLVGWLREHEARAEAFRTEEERFRNRRQQAENAVRRIKLYLFDAMRERGIQKTDTGKFVVRIQRNGTPSIQWMSADPFPREFVRTIEDEDRKAIQEAHKAGTLPPGFQVEYGSHLRIK